MNPEKIPQKPIPSDEERGKQKPLAPVFDIKTGERLTAEEIEVRKHPTWPVSINPDGSLDGLPHEISRKDVILFLGDDGQWYAQNPNKKLIEELKMWRTDWMD